MGKNIPLVWLVTMIPIVFSPGPANVTLAVFGARFGVNKSIPFVLGISLVVFLQAITAGYGLTLFINLYPSFFNLLKNLGSLYLIFLAIKFFYISKVAASEFNNRVPSFFDGLILQLFNMKGLLMATIMFSQFLNKENLHFLQIFQFSIALILLALASMILWVLLGRKLLNLFSLKKNVKIQNYIFGSMLLAAALWLMI